MTPNDLDPRDVAGKALRGWVWILVLSVLGGLAGLGVSYARPPVYAAEAVLGIGVDYGRTLPLDDAAMEHANDRVRALLLADDTLAGAASLSSLGGEERPDTARVAELREHLRLEDERGRWHLTAYAVSPQQAAETADAWAESSLTALHDASGHAWRAAALQTTLFGLGCTLEMSSEPAPRPVWRCASGEASPDAQDILGELMEEAALSRGVLPSLSFSLLQQAVPPVEPSVWGRGWLILAGMFLGGTLGFVYAVLGLPGLRSGPPGAAPAGS